MAAPTTSVELIAVGQKFLAGKLALQGKLEFGDEKVSEEVTCRESLAVELRTTQFLVRAHGRAKIRRFRREAPSPRCRVG